MFEGPVRPLEAPSSDFEVATLLTGKDAFPVNAECCHVPPCSVCCCCPGPGEVQLLFHFSLVMQEVGQGEITGIQGGFVCGIDEEDAVIDAQITSVCIFEGKLCFANPA